MAAQADGIIEAATRLGDTDEQADVATANDLVERLGQLARTVGENAPNTPPVVTVDEAVDPKTERKRRMAEAR